MSWSAKIYWADGGGYEIQVGVVGHETPADAAAALLAKLALEYVEGHVTMESTPFAEVAC